MNEQVKFAPRHVKRAMWRALWATKFRHQPGTRVEKRCAWREAWQQFRRLHGRIAGGVRTARRPATKGKAA